MFAIDQTLTSIFQMNNLPIATSSTYRCPSRLTTHSIVLTELAGLKCQAIYQSFEEENQAPESCKPCTSGGGLSVIFGKDKIASGEGIVSARQRGQLEWLLSHVSIQVT